MIAFYSESGCGKTFSSLLLARGIAGPSGKIVMIDTESGRGELYADVAEIGGYDVLRLEAPFTPKRHVEAIDAAEAVASVVVLDSGSHEWEGASGILDMAAANEESSKRAGLHNWRQPKFEHALFVQRLLRAKVPLIVCLRAKFKTRQGKDEKGKTVIVKDDHTSPIQAEDFIFESTCHAEVLPDHSIRLTKCSHPDLFKCFPTSGPIKVEHGRLIAQWCGGSTAKPSAGEWVASQAMRKNLWTATASIRVPGDKDWTATQQWLWDENCLSTEQTLKELTDNQMAEVIQAFELKMSEERKAAV